VQTPPYWGRTLRSEKPNHFTAYTQINQTFTKLIVKNIRKIACQVPNSSNSICINTSTLRRSYLQFATIDLEIKKESPRKRGLSI
jgi:hypothetical protein